MSDIRRCGREKGFKKTLEQELHGKNTKYLTREEARQLLIEAQNIKTSDPICTMRILKNNEAYRAVLYFNFQVIAVDVEIGKQLWYEKAEDSEQYFIHQIVYTKYQGQEAAIHLFPRNRNFSDPNICMIKRRTGEKWEYYVATIDDTLFYRNIEFGETETVFGDLERDFKPLLQNLQKCDKRYIRK